MKARWTPALFLMMTKAENGNVDGHRRTVDAALNRGWVEPVRQWTERSASRYHRRARATEHIWTVVGYRVTLAGVQALADERERRKYA
ncbi:hypothetical protein GCM10010327_19720 [Streptomyces nitrosporeus]|nr:hypothetical protein GCM10010327_19720 [Streptomyces nitrosporeus]